MKQRFVDLLKSTGRDGVEPLLAWLQDETDFYIAPCSRANHLSEPGGLVEHSLHVLDAMRDLDVQYNLKLPQDSMKLTALLHDLCKINRYTRTMKSQKRKDAKGNFVTDNRGKAVWDEVWSWEAQHSYFPAGHGEASALLAQRFIKLTDEEILAIRFHMAGFTQGMTSMEMGMIFGAAREKSKLVPALMLADEIATWILEVSDTK